MARSPTKTDQRSKDPSTLDPSPFKAAKRAKRGLTNAGLGNVNEALRFHDLGARFANPFLALGFFARLAARPFSGKEQEELQAEGRRLLLTLGVDEQTALDPFTGQEVVISLPISHLDRLDQFHALGLKRTILARARGYVELRGICNVEAATRLVDEMGGMIIVIPRPPAPDPAAAATPDGPTALETASAPVTTAPSDGPADSITLTDLPVETRASKAPTSTDVPATSGPAGEARKVEQNASAPSNAPVPQSAVAAPSAKAEIGHAPHGLKPSDPENDGKANPEKPTVDNVDQRNLPPFITRALLQEKHRQDGNTPREQTINRPIPRRIMPPVGEKQRT